MSRRPQYSEIFLQAERLGQLAKEERPRVTEDALRNMFSYLDDGSLGYITIPTLTAFLTKSGVIADEGLVYNEVLKYRESKKRSDEYFERPAANKVHIPYDEFRHFMTRTGLTPKEEVPLREAFLRLMKISPGMLAEREGSIYISSLFKQMEYWGIMTKDEIEQCKPFFGSGGRGNDILFPEKFIDKLSSE